MAQHPIVIVGAGIGGLCAAAALQRRQQPVCVVERAAALQPLGAGIVLSSNAMRALASVGLAEAVRRAGVELQHGLLRRDDGVVLQSVRLDRMGQRLGQSSVALHRGALQRVLCDAAGPVVTLNAALTSFTQENVSITAHLQQHNDITGSLLIGADGLRSRVRTTLWGDTVPRYAGYTCWRGVAEQVPPSVLEPGTSMETWGRGLRFGAVTTGPGQVYWFAVQNAPAGRRLEGEAGHAEVGRLFAGWHEPIARLIAATVPATVLHNDIFDRPPMAPWGRDDATLLGDAAHPTTPNMGQGACMAIEDAVVLAACVAEHGPTPKALRAYESLRHERTAQVVNNSWSMGRVAQASNPALCAVRNTLMRATPTWMVEMQTRRLLAFEPPA